MNMKKRKLNKKFVVFQIFLIGYLISLIFFTKSIISLTGIETLARIMVLIIFYLIFIIYIIVGLNHVAKRKKKNKSFIIFNVFISILIIFFSLGAFYIDKTYNSISTINKEKITYTSVLVSLKNNEIENNKNTKLGMIDDNTDIEGYILAKTLIKENDFNKPEIVYYNDYIEMITDLYNKKIDGCFLSNNYKIMFEEEFTDINSVLKIKYSYSEERVKENTSNNYKKLTEPFSLLLIGVDGTGDKLNANQSFNGDTLMVITFNPKNLNVTMLSIPRDTYVPIACRGNKEAKINSSAYGGTQCVIKTIQNLIDIDIDYYVKINFKGVTSLVDVLGGIDVDVPYALCEQDSERRFGKYTIFVEKGMQHLNGEQALALSRNRHYWSEYCDSKYTSDGNRNDFTRGQNQQLVVTAIAKEIKNINSISDFNLILNAISNTIDTNITVDQMLSLYEVGKNLLTNTVGNNEINIEKIYLNTASQYINNRSMQIYYPSSLKEVVAAMKENLELQAPLNITTFEFSANKTYEKYVAGKTTSGGVSLKDTVPSFIGKSRAFVSEWALERNIQVTYETVNGNNYGKKYENGYIISQSYNPTTLVSDIKEITLYVIKNSTSEAQDETKDEPKIDDPIQDLLN